jgi:hypothetical protein
MKMGKYGGTETKFSSVRITSKWSGVIYERGLSNINQNEKISEEFFWANYGPIRGKWP